MSSTNNNNTKYNNTSGSSNRPVYKSFCKVCQDAGKPESIYTNHNVRQSQDKNSPVTCPTLLAQECRVCYKRGHSSKYCPLNQGLKQSQGQQCLPVLKKPTFQPRTAVRQAPKNVFMVFDEEDAKDEVKRMIQEEAEAKEALLRKVAPAPVIGQKPGPMLLGYARIIALAPALNHTDALRKAFAEATKEKSNANKTKAVLAAVSQKPKFSWADCDSGSDCDEEEEETAW
jgi:hypothetical protein